MTLNYSFLFLILIALLFVGGCMQQNNASSGTSKPVADICVQACKEALAGGRNLDAGPCLLDPLPQNSEWVCDVAHSPRQSVDNLLENQCRDYRDGIAHHFVEVTPECKFIKAI